MNQAVRLRGADALHVVDPVWARVRAEAEEMARREPELASFVYATILNHDSLESAVLHRIAARLDHPDVGAAALRQAFETALEAEPAIATAIRADIVAVGERDPASTRHLDAVLYFKGYHALQAHRLAHRLYLMGRRDFALYLQSRTSNALQVDIHPAVPLGKGVFLDHGTGFVAGETAEIEDEVSILHGVTLGGTGKESGDRHPKIRRGVLLGAGAKILGNIEVGRGSRVAAGSVVLAPVPPCTTVAGVPAKVVGNAPCADPARSMDQILREVTVFDPGI